MAPDSSLWKIKLGEFVDGYLSKSTSSTKDNIGAFSSLFVSKIVKDDIFNGSLVWPSEVVTVKMQSEYVPEISLLIVIRLISVWAILVSLLHEPE